MDSEACLFTLLTYWSDYQTAVVVGTVIRSRYDWIAAKSVGSASLICLRLSMVRLVIVLRLELVDALRESSVGEGLSRFFNQVEARADTNMSDLP
jgi:hypothetical protein